MPKGSVPAAAAEHLPIRTVSRLTGLSADTLRVWERRYGFPKPRRAANGLRLFSDDDLRRLTLVVRALRWGYRPSEVVRRSAAELEQLLVRPTPPLAEPDAEAPHVATLLAALGHDDLQAVANGLRSAAATFGLKAFVRRVAGPLLTRVGDGWECGDLEVRHEHFLSQILTSRVRQLLGDVEAPPGAPVVLLTTLPGEEHTLGLELAALYVAAEGAVPRLLGAQAPHEDIVAAARAIGARAVGLSLSPGTRPREAARDARRLVEALPATCELWLGGRAAGAVRVEAPRLRVVTDWQVVETALAHLRSRPKAPATRPRRPRA